jgi:hypothetical protein
MIFFSSHFAKVLWNRDLKAGRSENKLVIVNVPES